jgi:hypothetical protein
VWTPKRVVLLAVGFALFLSGYLVYGRFLGGIDGLPALPEQYFPGNEPEPRPQDNRPSIIEQPTPLEQKLRMAFGEDCQELNYAIKLEVRSRNMVFASNNFTLMPDGRVQLDPLSLAVFGKAVGPNNFPEINTVRCKKAHLTFDRPITTPADMGKGHLIGTELMGDVNVANNRRTPQRDDDLTLFTQGPVYYKEDENKIWTNVVVEIKDLQSKPDPNSVRATGMDLYLAHDEPKKPAPEQAPGKLPPGTKVTVANKPKKAKGKTETISGVDLAVLRQDVEMHLYADSNSSFLGNSKDSAKKPAAPAASPTPSAGAATPQARSASKGTPAQVPSASTGTAAATAPQPERKSHIVIQTQGPFTFDVPRNHAQFDISQHPGPWHNRVSVNRLLEVDKSDQLDCERLELQFVRKNEGDKPAANRDEGGGLEIETAHATGQEVILSSDVECLEAHGNDFFYDARTHESTLKGDSEAWALQQGSKGESGMWALKEGNEIHAKELRILQQQGAQQATAIGPGQIDMLDKSTGRRSQHARWKKTLVTSKDGPDDLLVLTGDASFQDDDHKQLLRADTLKVWLAPPPPAADKATTPARSAGEGTATHSPGQGTEQDGHGGRKPTKLEALGHVVAHSPDLNIPRSDHLLVFFKDGPIPGPPPAAGGTPASAAPVGAAAPPPAVGQASPPPAAAGPVPALPAPAPAGAAPTAAVPPAAAGKPPEGAAAPAPARAPEPKPADKPSRPIELTARFVEAHVLRDGGRHEIERLWTEGGVHVLQDPAGPDDKGVDIRGETLQLTRQAEGSILVVTDANNLAQVRLDKIYIAGPQVNIDQVANKVWVDSAGAMQIDSNTNFRGDKLTRTVPLIITWDKNMFFESQFAEFHGGVQCEQAQSEQENSRMLCQSMQVFFDRPISLKQGDKGGPPPKVSKLNAWQKVRVEDREIDKGKLVKYQRIECPELAVDNAEGSMQATGPGLVRLLQRGGADGIGPAPSPPARGSDGRPAATESTDTLKPAHPTAEGKPGADDEMKLTIVLYSGRMYANNTKHTAVFIGDVEVTHVPSEDPNLQPNLDRLPVNGLYLKSDKLEVSNRPDAAGKSNQEMTATGHVYTQSRDENGPVTGRATVVKYNEAKDQVIFEGGDGGYAILWREKVRGQYEEMKGKKIIYMRRTNTFQGVEMNAIKGVSGGPP